MATITLTDDNFEDVVKKNDMVLIDFWAPWCAPCRGFGPVFEAASEKYPDVVFAKVNSDEQQAVAGAFDIRSIPFLMVFREQIILFAQAGALPPNALEAVIQQARAIDMAEVRKELAEQQKQGGAGAGAPAP